MQLRGLKLKTGGRKIVVYVMMIMMFSLMWATSPGTASAGIPATSLTIKTGYSGGPYTTAHTFSAAELSAMTQAQQAYTFIDSMPAVVMESAQGVKLADILTSSGINLDSIQSFTFYSTDGYMTSFTKSDLLDTPRYYYPNLPTHWSGGAPTPGADEGAIQVDTIMAILDYWKRFATSPDFTQMTGANAFRLVFGQVDTHTTNAFNSAKWVQEIDVTLSLVPVTGVTLDRDSDTITAGATSQLTATVSPANATNPAVTWNSDNTAVATVDSTGLVTAVAPGAANITVTTADGGFTDTCRITVINPGNPGVESFPLLSAPPSYFEQWIFNR